MTTRKSLRITAILTATILLLAANALAQPTGEFVSDANTYGLWPLNECSGTVAHDASGNSLDLNFEGDAAWAANGRWGCGGDFSGSTPKLNSPYLTGNGWDAITVEAWIYPTQMTGMTEYPILYRYRYYTTNPAFHFSLIGNGSIYAGIYTTGGGYANTQTDASTIAVNQWSHVAMTWTSGQQVKVWINGQMVAASATNLAGAIRNSTHPLTLGWFHDDGYGDFYFHGKIDEARMSNVVRYPASQENVMLETSFCLYRRTPTFSILKCGFAEGVYSSGNTGIRVWFGEHDLDQQDHMRFWDVNGTLLLDRIINYPAARSITVTLRRNTDREWTLIWDEGGPDQVIEHVTDSFATLDNPHFWVAPVGYYSQTGGFYLDDLSISTTIAGINYSAQDDFADGNWTQNPTWTAYDNEDQNFGISAGSGCNPPSLEGWAGNTGTDYTALYLPLVTAPVDSVCLETSFWLHRRTPTFSILMCGISNGDYSSTNRGVRMFFGEHDQDQQDYMRLWDAGGNFILNQHIEFPSDRWIKVTTQRTTAGHWTLIWDDGGADSMRSTINSADGLGDLSDPYFWVTPVGYYSVTGGFYLDDLSISATVDTNHFAWQENWDDGNWTSAPVWNEYQNDADNFGVTSEMGHMGSPCLEGWAGNTGTDYTALSVRLNQSIVANGVRPRSDYSARTFRVATNFPNPFNPTTRIVYSLSTPARVQLRVFNIAGQQMFESAAEMQGAGEHIFEIDGSHWATGVYPYTVTVGSRITFGKMMLLK